MIQDIRYALRRLWASPVFTLFAVITLALGIGVTTAIYSAVYALVLRQDSIKDIDRVVNIYHRQPDPTGWQSEMLFSWPDFQDLRVQQSHFISMTGWSQFGGPIVDGNDSEVIRGEKVDGSYFTVVEAQPVLGRLLQDADDETGAPAVAVISHAFWQRWFRGDPTIIGHRIRIGNQIFEVVGVVEPRFRGVASPNLMPTPVWIPIAATTGTYVRERSRDNRNEGMVFVKGRLKPGSTIDDARKEIAVIAAKLDVRAPMVFNRALGAFRMLGGRKWIVTPATSVQQYQTLDNFAVSLGAALMAGVGLVLLVACTNLANLMMARASARRHEFAVRLALGGSRWRLIREQLIEGCLIAAAGGFAGMLVARFVMVLLSGSFHLAPGIFVEVTPAFNASVALVGIGAAGLTLLVFSLLPAFHTTRIGVGHALRADGATSSQRWRGRRFLITAQVIVSTIFVTIAFLCAQQIYAVASLDLGVDLDRIATAQVNSIYSRFDEQRMRFVMNTALENIRGKVGVERVALASSIPLRGGDSVTIKVPGRRAGAHLIIGTPEMFEVFGTRLKRGRLFNDQDASTMAPVAVISEVTAARMFEGLDPLGRQIQIEQVIRYPIPGGPPEIRTNDVVTVVGVVADPNERALNDLNRPESRAFIRTGDVFRPWSQAYLPNFSIVVRSAGDPSRLVDTVRQGIRDAASDAVVDYAGTGLAIVGAANVMPKAVGSIAALLGGFALMLSLVGLYGVLAHMVAGRTREMGVRIALGADRRRIAAMIVLQGLEPVIVGLVLGLIVGAGARSAFQGLIVQYFPAFDPLVFALVPIPFAIAATVACYLPARRAARVDPLVALRDL